MSVSPMFKLLFSRIDNHWTKKWSESLWQILRYHHNTTKVDITFSPDYGVPLWTLTVKYHDETILHTQGVHLYKRLRAAVAALQALFGDKAYVYENYTHTGRFHVDQKAIDKAVKKMQSKS